MRWDCETQGCFNVKCRPKIEQFCDCFPGKISFGDVDAIVEINGQTLMLEWKSDDRAIKTGQRIMFETLTKEKTMTVLVVVGNAETMQVEKYLVFFEGRQSKWFDASLLDVKEFIQRWVKWAKA
jgi:hypothetical protein